MFEYRVDTHFGMTPPNVLKAPEAGFRLRDIRPIETGRMKSISINYGGSHSTPYPSSESDSAMYQWVVTWERYVEEQESK